MMAQWCHQAPRACCLALWQVAVLPGHLTGHKGGKLHPVSKSLSEVPLDDPCQKCIAWWMPLSNVPLYF